MINFVTYNKHISNNVRHYAKISFNDYLLQELGHGVRYDNEQFITTKVKTLLIKWGQNAALLENAKEDNPNRLSEDDSTLKDELNYHKNWFRSYILNKENDNQVDNKNDPKLAVLDFCKKGGCKPQQTNPDAKPANENINEEALRETDKEGSYDENGGGKQSMHHHDHHDRHHSHHDRRGHRDHHHDDSSPSDVPSSPSLDVVPLERHVADEVPDTSETHTNQEVSEDKVSSDIADFPLGGGDM